MYDFFEIGEEILFQPSINIPPKFVMDNTILSMTI